MKKKKGMKMETTKSVLRIQSSAGRKARDVTLLYQPCLAWRRELLSAKSKFWACSWAGTPPLGATSTAEQPRAHHPLGCAVDPLPVCQTQEDPMPLPFSRARRPERR